jgi:hypothetical protein
MADYSLAVDTCVERLVPEERQQLCATGQLPGWFTAAVEEKYKIVRNRVDPADGVS